MPTTYDAGLQMTTMNRSTDSGDNAVLSQRGLESAKFMKSRPMRGSADEQDEVDGASLGIFDIPVQKAQLRP